MAQLIEEEFNAGFIDLVPGGLQELHSRYARTAVGKLGVVIAEGRSPRLVVDSSISNVTANTIIPNHMMLPRISDVMECAPLEMAQQQMTQLTLDVAKAHRRILIDPKDGGMLCFHANGKLYRCVTLNFGARSSGWYWGRVARLMVRTGHSSLGYGHILWQYVDDLLAWLDSVSAPLWASLLVVLFLIFGIPLLWHKAALSMEVDWMGWRISLSSWSITVPESKLTKILAQLQQFHGQKKVPVKDLQSPVGRLLWLTSAWHHLRPLLIPLYKALSRLPITMVGMDHIVFQHLLANFATDLVLDTDLTRRHHALCRDLRLVRVANTHVDTVEEIHKLHLRSRRVWVGVIDPSSPNRLLECDAHAALQTWEQLLTSTPFSLSMSPPTPIEVSATADAMASKNLAGLGGLLSFPTAPAFGFSSKSLLKRLQHVGHGLTMICHIGAWELLAQYALTYCIEATLPPCRNAVSCIQGSDNSAADAANAKGLSMTPAMACVLAPFFAFMRRCQIYPKITHIPGHLNDIADALSRFKQPLPEPLSLSNQCEVRWQSLLDPAIIFTAQIGRKWPVKFDLGEKRVLAVVRRLRVHQSIVCCGVALRLVDFRFCFGVSGIPHKITQLVIAPSELGVYVLVV